MLASDAPRSSATPAPAAAPTGTPAPAAAPYPVCCYAQAAAGSSSSSSDEEDGSGPWEECFICAEVAPVAGLVTDVCACRKRFMHVACQRQMLEKSAFAHGGPNQAPSCPVCRREYTNARLEYTRTLSAEGKLCVVLILCNVLLVVCAVVELRAWAFGEGCGVCLQLGLALIVEATIGGTTIVWVSMSTTLRMQTHRALVWLPERGDPAQRRPPSRDVETVLL